MSRILILLAHPTFQKSRLGQAMIEGICHEPNVTIRDLYELYPDFHIDVAAEQAALKQADLIVFQHPVYWFSAPALMKQWMDSVLTMGWAFDAPTPNLTGKYVLSALTTGDPEQTYTDQGSNNHPLRDFLLPFAQTVKICGMTYLDPFIIYGGSNYNSLSLDDYGHLYRQHLMALLSSHTNQGA